MKRIFDFYNGKINGYRLVQPYRTIWTIFWWVVTIALVLIIMFRFFEWWDGVIMRLNRVIW